MAKYGDKNYKFFFASTLIRRRQKIIYVIKDQNSWIKVKRSIESYFINEFRTFYSSMEL